MNEETKQKLKEEGLNLAEKVVTEAVNCVFNIITVIIKDSKNQVDDMLLPMIGKAKEIVLEYVNKINGVNE